MHTIAAPVARNAALLFGYLAFQTTHRESIAQLESDGIVKFMVNMMTAYPHEVSVTYGACVYFEKNEPQSRSEGAPLETRCCLTYGGRFSNV
jgi:hypothetical protein